MPFMEGNTVFIEVFSSTGELRTLGLETYISS